MSNTEHNLTSSMLSSQEKSPGDLSLDIQADLNHSSEQE